MIHLRRPPVLQVQDTPFVPDGVSLDSIDRRWRELCASNPAYFDGRIHHVIGVHRNGHGGAVIHVQECAYRFHAVRDDDLRTGACPLGVKGLVARDGRYLLGRRAPCVAHYANTWEFAPGGVVDYGVTPAQTVIAELREEVGLTAAGEPLAVAIIFDALLHTWEIVYRLDIADHEQPAASTAEYSQIAWCAAEELPRDLSPLAQRMVSLIP